MFVYNDMSIDASLQSVGSFNCSIWFINSLMSFKYEGRHHTYGCSHLSTNWDIRSVMLSQLENIGQIPIGFLWIFLRNCMSYGLRVVCKIGTNFLKRNPFVYRLSSFIVMISLSLWCFCLALCKFFWASNVLICFSYVVISVLDYGWAFVCFIYD